VLIHPATDHLQISLTFAIEHHRQKVFAEDLSPPENCSNPVFEDVRRSLRWMIGESRSERGNVVLAAWDLGLAQVVASSCYLRLVATERFAPWIAFGVNPV
jgi:hypothetical protein